MIFGAHRRERRADRLEDLASALDAGLDPRAALGDLGESELDGGLVAALERRDLSRGPVDRAVLHAGESAGDLPRALRERAEAQRAAAQLEREAWTRCSYPLFLVCFALAISALVARSAWTLVIGLGTVAVLGVFVHRWVQRVRHSSHGDNRRIPILSRLLNDLGELPYLTALRGLYRAGTRIDEAHRTAAEASGIGFVRHRLRAATDLVARGEPLTKALAEHRSLQPETLDLLVAGEKTGDLEESLSRAIARRRDTLTRGLRTLVRAVGGGVYAIAILLAAYVVITFYSGYFAALR